MRKAGLACFFLVGCICFLLGSVPSSIKGSRGKTASQGVLRERPRSASATPDSISNLAFWYKADAGVYSDAGTTLATNGQSVQQWNDQSTNGRNLSAFSSGFKPVYTTGMLNGKPGLVFTSDGLISTTTITKPITIFFVYGYTSLLTGKNSLFIGHDGTGVDFGSCYIGAAGALNNSEGSTNNSYTSVNPLVEGSTITVSMKYGVGRYIRVNEGTKQVTGDDVTGSWTHVIVGNLFDGSFGPTNANIFEVVGYNKNLSTAEEQTVLDYLQAKWGHY